MKAIILCGEGEEGFAPLTLERPLPLLSLFDKPLLAHQAGLLRRHGVREIGVALPRLSRMVEDAMGDGEELGVRFTWLPCRGAGELELLAACAGFLGEEDALVLPGGGLGDLDLSALLAFHQVHRSAATLALAHRPPAAGRALVFSDGEGRVERLLDALQGHVMEGRPVAMPDAALEEGRLLYQDKKKSLAWARTNRLQLPRVRKLPARLSGKRILTEEDVVKPADPGRGGENTPLASLASRPSGLTESVASGIRALRKVMGRGVSADVEDILSNEEMGKLIPRHDLSLAERLFKLPHWVAKDHAGFAKVYDRQLRRVEERSAALKATLEQVPLLFDGDASKRLGQKEQEQLAAMIWKWDGKQIGPLNAIEKFNVVDQTVNGRDVLELNLDYQKKFRAWLREQPEPERVKQAFRQVREALDAAFLRAYNKMAAMSDLADTDLEMYRTEFGNIHTYFPHQRTGKYFVVAKVGKETVFRKHFDVPFGSSVREEWAKIVAEHRKDFPDATWEDPREAQKLPDDILGAPIDPEAMEQIISAAASRLGDSEQAERVRSTLLSGVADVLKARGFGAHGIHRQNIPGFETQDVKGVLYSYMAGLNGWLTKMEAAADFARALGKIDASASPRLWEYAAQYTKDMLRNSDQIDRITGNIKSVAFAWYLGGNIKTAVVNLTQNAVVGVPRLQQYVTGEKRHGYHRPDLLWQGTARCQEADCRRSGHAARTVRQQCHHGCLHGRNPRADLCFAVPADVGTLHTTAGLAHEQGGDLQPGLPCSGSLPGGPCRGLQDQGLKRIRA